MTSIGSLRHRMQIQTYKETHSGNHDTNRVWTTIQTVYASIKNAKGTVTFGLQQIEQNITHKITIRYIPNVTTENWLLMESRRFRIRDVTDVIEKKRFLILSCEEVFIAQDAFVTGSDSTGEPLRQNLPDEN